MDQQGEILDARNKNKLSGKAVIWILLAVIVLLLAAVGALAYQQIKNRFEKPQKESASPTATVASTATPKTIDAGVTWITPVALSDLGFFAKNQNFDGMGELSSVNYYKVGATADGNDIIDAVITYAPTSYDVFRIIKKSDGYYKVTKNSPNAFGNTDAIVESGLKIDGTTEFKSLNPDKKMIKGQMKLTFSFNGGIEKESGYSNGSKIDDTNTGPIYSETGEEISGSDGALEMERYYLKLNDSTRAYYEPNPTFLRDDGTLDISWSDSSKSGLSYQKVATGGCGGGAGTFPAVAKADLLSGKEQVASDAKMYFVSDKDNPLDRFIYDIYKNSVGSPRSNDDFIANIGMLVWTDGYGANIVYSNRDFSFEGECGKPVVYLYPEQPTQVSVKVGAKITKSEPTYGAGWSGIAYPPGKIVIDNKTYPYLFWEGLGLGRYPSIQTGLVVAGSSAIDTIKGQLTQIGLNSREITDFLDFWAPKLPKTSYVRLTWLQNEQLDQLAPLQIRPTPQSVIRVFLDFQGLDHKIDIAPQTLQSYKRSGFTAVEWGGLLSK